MSERLRRLVLVLGKHPLRAALVLGVLLPLVGFGGWYVAAEFLFRYHLRAAERDLAGLNLPGGIRHLTRCLRLKPADIQTHFLLARTARRGGAFDDAEHHLELCKELRGTSPAIDLEEQLLRVQQGDMGGMERALRKRAEQDSPETPLILEALAQGYLANYDISPAMTCIERLLKDQPNHIKALLLHGQTLEQIGRAEEAEADYRRVLEIDPNELLARASVGDVMLKFNRPREALEQFEFLARRRPDDPQAQLGLACCMRKLGQADDAKQILDKLLQNYPDEPRVPFERGMLALDEAHLPEAEGFLRRAYKQNPFDVKTMHALHQCLQGLEKKVEAKTLLKKMEQVDRDRKRLIELSKTVVEMPRAAVERAEAGAICLRLGMFGHAFSMLKRSLEDDPNNLQALESLADYYERTGKPDRASTCRKRAEEVKQMIASQPKH